VERLLKEGGDLNARSRYYGTALNVAALREDSDITKMLVKENIVAILGESVFRISNVKIPYSMRGLAHS